MLGPPSASKGPPWASAPICDAKPVEASLVPFGTRLEAFRRLCLKERDTFSPSLQAHYDSFSGIRTRLPEFCDSRPQRQAKGLLFLAS